MMSKIILSLVIFLSLACDPDRHNECEWYLMPEPNHIELVEKGWVSLCARNYVTNKQRCFIQGKLDFAEKIYGKAFRFTTLELDDSSYPQKVKSVKVCTPKKPFPQN